MSEIGGRKLGLSLKETKDLFLHATSRLRDTLERCLATLPRPGSRRRFQKAVSTVAMAALESPTPQDFPKCFLRETLLATGMQAGMVCLRRDGEGGFATVCQEGFPESVAREIGKVSEAEELILRAMSTKTRIAVRDLAASDEAGASKWARSGFRSLVGVPIRAGVNVLGSVVLLGRRKGVPGRFGSKMLDRLTGLMGVALQRAWREEELRAALTSLRRMSRLGGETPSSQSMDEALGELAHRVCEAALAFSSMITLTNDAGGVVERASCGFGRRVSGPISGLDAVSARVERTGICQVVSSREELQRLLGGEIHDGEQECAVCFPLRVGGRGMGSLWIGYESARMFPSWELDHLQSLADLVSSAIDKARLHWGIRERIRQSSEVEEQWSRISSCTELKDVLQAIADSARELLGAGFAVGCFWRGGVAEHAISVDPQIAEERGKEGENGEAIVMKVLASILGRSQAASLSDFLAHLALGSLPREKVRAGNALAVPLLGDDDEPAGVLVVGEAESRGSVGDGGEDLLDGISRQGAISIRNVLRAERAQKFVRECRVLLDNVGVAVATVDGEGLISTVNKLFEELTGYSAQEVAGKVPFFDVVPEMERKESGGGDSAEAGHSSERGERQVVLRVKGGTEKKVTLWTTDTENRGNLAFFFRESPELRRTGTPGLEERETPRGGRIALRALSELEGSLNGVTDCLSELLGRQWPLDTREALEAASAETREGRRTLNAIRILTEPQALTKEAVDINELITEVLEERKEELQRDTIGVVLRLDADLAAVRADREQVRWALETLIEDSRREMRTSDEIGTLSIQTERQGMLGRITVCDTRRAVPTEGLERILQLPQAEDKGRVALAACGAIVEQHGWRVFARGTAGEGVAFVIEFPLPEDEPSAGEGEKDGAVVPGSSEQEQRDVLSGEILAVSWEDVVLDFLDYYLSSGKRCVEKCRDALEARRRLESEEYDLVFWDVGMPGLNGADFLSWLRKYQPHVEPRVVFIVEEAVGAEVLDFMRETESRWLQKPFDLTELRELVQDALGEASDA